MTAEPRPSAEEAPNVTERRRLTGPERIGRNIGIAMFWCMAVYVVGMSTFSVTSELFGFANPPANEASAPRCAAAMQLLHRSLLEQTSAELKLPRDPQRQRRWLADWDKDFAETRDECGSLKDTRHTLLALRERVEALLRNYARDDVPLSERIERSLERYAGHHQET